MSMEIATFTDVFQSFTFVLQIYHLVSIDGHGILIFIDIKCEGEGGGVGVEHITYTSSVKLAGVSSHY